MPIDLKEERKETERIAKQELARDKNFGMQMLRILNYLKDHSNLAFSIEELSTALSISSKTVEKIVNRQSFDDVYLLDRNLPGLWESTIVKEDRSGVDYYHFDVERFKKNKEGVALARKIIPTIPSSWGVTKRENIFWGILFILLALIIPPISLFSASIATGLPISGAAILFAFFGVLIFFIAGVAFLRKASKM